MKLVICIDDTDNLESKGTGSIADEMRAIITQKGFGKCGVITRHQLLLHEDIPYTSHNSSMCFDCDIDEIYYDKLEKTLSKYLKMESAEGSDPGICIAKLTSNLNKAALVNFGLSAKRRIMTKEEAYNIAESVGVYLKEEGGTGQGIIGALAGIGLRLGGNDGEVKGEIDQFTKDEIYTVEQLISNSIIDSVCDSNLNPISKDKKVYVIWKTKPVLAKGKIILIVKWSEGKNIWVTMQKKDMREFGNQRIYKEGCAAFAPDVLEEHVNDDEHSCLNCRYRRWTGEILNCTYNLITSK